MNDLDFGDMPFAGGTVADFCHRFPNSPACSHPTQPGFGSASSPIGGHHDNRHDGGNRARESCPSESGDTWLVGRSLRELERL